jgi:hypothetical protein
VLTEYSYLRDAKAWQKDALVALNFFVAESFVRELTESRLLYSIPVSNRITQTYLKPRIVPLSYAAGTALLLHDEQITVCDDFSIVVLGMFGDNSPPQTVSTETRITTATHISRRLFLDSVLHVLEGVNEKTAIIANPNFARFNGGESFLQLSVVQRAFAKPLAFTWRQVATENGCLQYEWTNRVGWSYEHVGDLVRPEDSGSYSVKCE